MDEYRLVIWTRRDSVEDDTLDTQHKRMFALINTLYSQMRAGISRTDVLDDLQGLIEYGEVHFRAEEDAMRASGYPDLADHQRMHRQYMRDLQLRADSVPVDSRDVPVDLLGFVWELFDFLQGWWRHEVKMDRQYVPYLRRLQKSNQ
jgi:hemerythrin-like metal-binding protein